MSNKTIRLANDNSPTLRHFINRTCTVLSLVSFGMLGIGMGLELIANRIVFEGYYSMSFSWMVIFAFVARWTHLDNRPGNTNRCRECDYDLTGNKTGRCPECGHGIAGDLRESD